MLGVIIPIIFALLILAPGILWASLNVIEEVSIKGWAKFRLIFFTFIACYGALIIMFITMASLL